MSTMRCVLLYYAVFVACVLHECSAGSEHEPIENDRNNTLRIGQSERSLPRHIQFATLLSRYESFRRNWPGGGDHPGDANSTQRLAALGFFYTGTGCQMRCFHCGKESSWRSGEDPLLLHIHLDEECPHLRDTVPAEILAAYRIRARREGVNSLHQRPSNNREREHLVHGNQSTLEQRLRTYANWPTNTQSPQRLAEAGLFYAGRDDCTRCFTCGGGLRNWEASDDPWMEHARWYPNCPYVRKKKGDAYVRQILERTVRTQKGAAETQESSRRPLDTPIVRASRNVPRNNPELPWPDLPVPQLSTGSTHDDDPLQWTTEIDHPAYSNKALRLCIEYDFSRQAVRETIDELKDSGSVVTWTIVKRELLSRRERGEVLPTDPPTGENAVSDNAYLIEENQRLRRSQLCQLCDERDRSIVFLPCGHLVACEACANDYIACPECGKIIKGKIRTYIS